MISYLYIFMMKLFGNELELGEGKIEKVLMNQNVPLKTLKKN